MNGEIRETARLEQQNQPEERVEHEILERVLETGAWLTVKGKTALLPMSMWLCLIQYLVGCFTTAMIEVPSRLQVHSARRASARRSGVGGTVLCSIFFSFLRLSSFFF